MKSLNWAKIMGLLFFMFATLDRVSLFFSNPVEQDDAFAPVTILMRNSLKSLTFQVKQRIIDVDTKNSLGDCLRFVRSFYEFAPSHCDCQFYNLLHT